LLADRIRSRRKSLGLTLLEASEAVGVTRQYLSEVESGRQPGVATLLALTDLLTLPTEEWLPEFLKSETRILPLIHLGEYLAGKGDIQGAFTVARHLRPLLRTTAKGHGRAFHLLGLLEYRRGHFGRALVWFRRAESATLRGASGISRGDALYNTALAMRQAGLFTASVRRFEKAAEVYQSNGDRVRSGYAWLSDANTFLRFQAYREALHAYRRASRCLRDDPWQFDAKLGEAICLGQVASVSVALHALQGLAAPPKDVERQARLEYNLAVAFRRAENVGAAVQHILSAVAAPESATEAFRGNALAELCLCLSMIGDVSGAFRAADQFARYSGSREPEDVAAIRLLSMHLGHPVDVPPPSSHPVLSYEQRLWATLSFITRPTARGHVPQRGV